MSTANAAASPIPDLYLSILPDELRTNFQAVLHHTGLESEIALLRVQIGKLIKHDPDNLKLMLRIVHLIERLTKCNLQMRKENTPPGKRSGQDPKLDDVFYPPSALTDPDATKPASVDRPGPETTPTPEIVSEKEVPVPAAVSETATSNPVAAAAVPQHRTSSTSSVAKKAHARLPAPAQTLFQKKKHKKH